MLDCRNSWFQFRFRFDPYSRHKMQSFQSVLKCYQYRYIGFAYADIPILIKWSFTHSEKKEYQNGTPGALLLQMVPLFQRGTLFSLIIMFIVFMKQYPWVTGAPKTNTCYGQSNSAPWGTVSVPFFFGCTYTRTKFQLFECTKFWQLEISV